MDFEDNFCYHYGFIRGSKLNKAGYFNSKGEEWWKLY